MRGRLQVPEALRPNPRHASVLSHVLPHLQVRGVGYKEGVSCGCCQVQLLQLNWGGRGSQCPEERVSDLCLSPVSPFQTHTQLSLLEDWSVRTAHPQAPGPGHHQCVGPLRSLTAKQRGLNTLEPESPGQRGLSLGDKV